MRLQGAVLTVGFVPAVHGPVARLDSRRLRRRRHRVAVLGVLVASRRAAKVRPLDALREAGAAARVMTASRWVFGLLFLAGSIAMLILVASVGGEAASRRWR